MPLAARTPPCIFYLANSPLTLFLHALTTHNALLCDAYKTKVGRHFDGIAPASPLHERAGLRGVGAPSGGGSTSGAQGSGVGVECSSMTDRELFSTYSVST